MRKNTSTAAARKAAHIASISNVSIAALNEGRSGALVDAAVVAALKGKKAYAPDDKGNLVATPLAREILDAALVGYLASRLYGDANIPDAEKLAKALAVRAAANADGTGTLKKGQRRRTKVEQAAYSAASMARSRLLKRAGLAPVKAPSNGNKGNKRQPNKGTGKVANDNSGAMIPAAKAAKFMPPARKEMTLQRVAAYLQSQGVAMQATVETAMQVADKTGAPAPTLAMINAVNDFRAAINKAASTVAAD